LTTPSLAKNARLNAGDTGRGKPFVASALDLFVFFALFFVYFV